MFELFITNNHIVHHYFTVIDVLSASLPSMAGVERPFMPFSRINPLITSSSVFAQIRKTSAIGEFVIHILLPVKAYPPETLLALFSCCRDQSQHLIQLAQSSPPIRPMRVWGDTYSSDLRLVMRNWIHH